MLNLQTMHLGTKIKIARISKGLTQHELAVKINKTRPLVSHIEQTGKVNHYTLMQIIKALNIALDDIENIVNEPVVKYKIGKGRNADLADEAERLREENSILKELVKSQKEIIEMLRGKKGNKPSSTGKSGHG